MWKDFLKHHALTRGPLPACLFSLHTFTIPSGSFPHTPVSPHLSLRSFEPGHQSTLQVTPEASFEGRGQTTTLGLGVGAR